MWNTKVSDDVWTLHVFCFLDVKDLRSLALLFPESQSVRKKIEEVEKKARRKIRCWYRSFLPLKEVRNTFPYNESKVGILRLKGIDYSSHMWSSLYYQWQVSGRPNWQKFVYNPLTPRMIKASYCRKLLMEESVNEIKLIGH
jgi:hypothetical protein